MAGPQNRQDRLLALIRRCRELADKHPDTRAAQQLLDLAAQHVQNSSDRAPRPPVPSPR
jgi:hypothetical protein